MKWIALAASSFLFASCSAWPVSATLLSTATAGATALTGKGLTVTVNVMSNNTTNTCTCKSCPK